MTKVDSLYMCPWSLNDPLCQSQSLAYIRGLVRAGYKFALITFENDKFAMGPVEQESIRESLADAGIEWYPIKWDSGLGLGKKIRSIVAAVVTGSRAIRRHRPKLLHSRSSLPLPVALVLVRLFKMRFLYDADSVLSEEYVDIGYASRDSTGVKLLRFCERAARKRAARMVVLTQALKGRFAAEGVRAPIDVIPCCVDTERFRVSARERQRLRQELGLREDQRLLVYVGKPGSWYLVEETFEFFRESKSLDASAKLLIVTQSDAAAFHEIADEARIDRNDYFIKPAAANAVPGWLAAADAGLSLIRQVPSKQGSSPVKIGEYLAAGLPVVTTDRIGDCTSLITKANAGVVVDRLDAAHLKRAARGLSELLNEDSNKIRARCRRAADLDLSVTRVAAPAYLRIYRELVPNK
jgi:glycosyltransferase involved in cell wall biosynthesis